jgi:dolichol-phosphate mannosyltransferase
VGPLIREILAQAETIDVLVVDDGSPDGTGEAVRAAMAEAPGRVELLDRGEKGGRGAAVIAAFKKGLADPRGYRVFFEMDADFSHHPREIPKFLAKLESTDMVIGSRYVEGGGTANWGVGRRLVSFGGSFYARALLGVGIRDLTGGFKCYRRRVLETLDLDAIHSKGYAFQIETTYRALRAGFEVVEVPITFADREVGGSKMSKGIVVEAIWKVPRLRLEALLGRL